MKCPVCKEEELRAIQKTDQPKLFLCGSCEGHWLAADDYSMWLDSRKEILPATTFEAGTLEIVDTKRAKLCPACKHLIFGYRVDRQTKFSLDYCSQCSGVWFDKNEWEALVSCNLHDEFYKVFTTSWQSKIKELDRKSEFEAMYLRRFGDDFSEIKRIRTWLENHQERDAILGYLTAENPYS